MSELFEALYCGVPESVIETLNFTDGIIAHNADNGSDGWIIENQRFITCHLNTAAGFLNINSVRGIKPLTLRFLIILIGFKRSHDTYYMNKKFIKFYRSFLSLIVNKL